MFRLSSILFALVFAASAHAAGDNAPAPAPAQDADALARQVAERPANRGRVGTMKFRLTSSSDRVREREALMIHSKVPDTERIAIFFTKPSLIEETAFLSFNHDVKEDENWLFLPATDRVRRLPVSDRGDYFLGTDLTYGDIKDNFKFGLSDWTFESGGTEDLNGRSLPVLLGKARTPEIGLEMGYASFRAVVDPESRFPVWIEYTDTDGEPLKRVEVLEIGLVGDAQTALHFTAENLQTGHWTEVEFADMRYVPDLDESAFDPDALAFGVPRVD